MVRARNHRRAGPHVLARPLAFRPQRADASPHRPSDQGVRPRGAGDLSAGDAHEMALPLVVAVGIGPTNRPEPGRQSAEAERDDVQPRSDELELLQARVAALEAELLELEARANRAVVEAQEKTYWLDRWRIDLNAIMERDATQRLLAAAERARALWRALTRRRG
jgi:hypothetical protein